jgi:hypothetical protein
MKKFIILLALILTSVSYTANAAQPSQNPNKKPITEEMIKKRNATVTYMDANYKIAMDNLEKTYKLVLEAKKNPKNSAAVDRKLSSDKITKIYTYYKDKINMAYENDKRYILQYYGE